MYKKLKANYIPVPDITTVYLPFLVTCGPFGINSIPLKFSKNYDVLQTDHNQLQTLNASIQLSKCESLKPLTTPHTPYI